MGNPALAITTSRAPPRSASTAATTASTPAVLVTSRPWNIALTAGLPDLFGDGLALGFQHVGHTT